jgi:ATP-dependent Clp protease ATP-binding subunit ClpB
MSEDALAGFDLEAQRALARAQRLARTRHHAVVAPAHLLAALLESPKCRAFSILMASAKSLDGLRQRVDARLALVEPEPQGGVRLGKSVLALMERGLDEAREQGAERADTRHLLLALAGSRSPLREMLEGVGLSRARVIEQLMGTSFGSTTADPSASPSTSGAPASPKEEAQAAAQDVLERYSRDITAAAEAGELDPVVGRETELRRVVQVLCRRAKNNPVLIGSPGVGKTAVVEGLAQLFVSGAVPKALQRLRILALDLGSVVAGAKFRGEFEERLRSILARLKSAKGGILLFIDEVHSLVGAGQSSGGGLDAANLLKPALARGELRCIGATTPEEYRLYLEKDKALVRRFQPIDIAEPDDLQALAILRGLRSRFEVHHGVRIRDDALEGAVRLSRRYVGDRCLPDKAIDVLDEAASRLRVELESQPDELAELDVERARLQLIKESRRNPQEVEAAKERLDALVGRRAQMVEQWHTELELLDRCQKMRLELQEVAKERRKALDRGDLDEAARIEHGQVPELEKKLSGLEKKLASPDLEPRLLSDLVTADEVAAVVATWTGIPVDAMLASERERLRRMEAILAQRVKGQPEAIALISAAIRRARVGLKDPHRPIGSFLFLGPTGVGKTELAKALAEFLFHGEDAIVRLDMSEFMEKHAAARLVGAPPGYVGFESGGQLTEAVRRNPYSIVLFDEVEKAHVEVFDLLLQVLDDGRLTDSWGRTVDMSNTVIVMTSNSGARQILEHAGHVEAIRTAVQKELSKTFRPEFLNRIDETIIFKPLAKDQLREIVDLLLRDLDALLGEKGLRLQADAPLKDALVEAGWDPAFGARPLRRAVARLVSDPVAVHLLDKDPPAGTIIRASWRDEALTIDLEPQSD